MLDGAGKDVVEAVKAGRTVDECPGSSVVSGERVLKVRDAPVWYPASPGAGMARPFALGMGYGRAAGRAGVSVPASAGLGPIWSDTGGESG